jgi:pimeloyl-ACP methyl ester carboxylesterase
MLALLLIGVALGTVGFDPAAPEARFTDQETRTQDGGTQLWSAIERHRDPGGALFAQEEFSWALAWPEQADWAPWIATCFGSAQPDSASFLLHMGPGEPSATGTPILLVPGAGDNGSRAFVTLASHLDGLGRPVYALTFAHPHGDLFMQAEVVADAIARIRHRTGAERVDVVGHSKGGISAALYTANHAEARWGDADYQAHATVYRGDVRRLVLVATPLGGLDTPFRWPVMNLGSLEAEAAVAPSSWSFHYPMGSGVPAVFDDLRRQDPLPGDGDLFPGQRQLLAPQDHALPGSLAWLGAYALQPDWWTTWHGGWGFESWSEGIDAAVATSADEDGRSLLEQLEDAGVDPEVELFLLAGENPIVVTGWEAWWTTWFDRVWLDLGTAGVDLWAMLSARLVGDGLLPAGLAESDLQGLAAGKLVLGEISGPSDGLLFTDSALRSATLTGRGAEVIEQHTADLSHLDLLYASPVTGQLMQEQAAADPLESGWMLGLGQRYAAEDSVGWIEAALADPPATVDTGDTGTDTLDSADPDSGLDEGEPATDPGCGCGAPPLGLPIFPSLLALAALVARRREDATHTRNEQCT